MWLLTWKRKLRQCETWMNVDLEYHLQIPCELEYGYYMKVMLFFKWEISQFLNQKAFPNLHKKYQHGRYVLCLNAYGERQTKLPFKGACLSLKIIERFLMTS